MWCGKKIMQNDAKTSKRGPQILGGGTVIDVCDFLIEHPLFETDLKLLRFALSSSPEISRTISPGKSN